MLLTSKSIINILYDILAFTEAPLSSLHYGNNFSISLPVVDRMADCSSVTVRAYLASLHLVSGLPHPGRATRISLGLRLGCSFCSGSRCSMFPRSWSLVLSVAVVVAVASGARCEAAGLRLGVCCFLLRVMPELPLGLAVAALTSSCCVTICLVET